MVRDGTLSVQIFVIIVQKYTNIAQLYRLRRKSVLCNITEH